MKTLFFHPIMSKHLHYLGEEIVEAYRQNGPDKQSAQVVTMEVQNRKVLPFPMKDTNITCTRWHLVQHDIVSYAV